MAVTKWSVSVEQSLAARVESRVGDRGLSGFVARAVEHELERDILDEFLVELDSEFGAVPPEMIDPMVVQLVVFTRHPVPVDAAVIPGVLAQVPFLRIDQRLEIKHVRAAPAGQNVVARDRLARIQLAPGQFPQRIAFLPRSKASPGSGCRLR